MDDLHQDRETTFRVAGGPPWRSGHGGGCGFSRSSPSSGATRRFVESFDSASRPGATALTLTGEERISADGNIEITGMLLLEEIVHLRVEGLENAFIMVDDKPMSVPAAQGPGNYKIVIRGRVIRGLLR